MTAGLLKSMLNLFCVVFVVVVCIFYVLAAVVSFIVVFRVLCFCLNMWLIRAMCFTCLFCSVVVLLPPG
jgi:hypothetical protein